ncbi:MAG TPA: I78 family peptidase inhibitor [Allosphingosinicella sp.]|nr:I78 family peptidase inhibitor [Allosphingosinicella sp.]
MRLVLLALAGCATTTTPDDQCSADRLSNLVGRPATPELGAEAQRRSGAARLRWIRPGDMVTMDFSPRRLNIHLDAQGRVDHFACG